MAYASPATIRRNRDFAEPLSAPLAASGRIATKISLEVIRQACGHRPVAATYRDLLRDLVDGIEGRAYSGVTLLEALRERSCRN